MILKFHSIILHNFLSYGHAEIDLENKHYCLVSGQNNNPKDNALSNGSGKSTFGSAICWALTGETIQGLTSGIKNINVEEDLCYCTLDFSADENHFVITRYKNPKSDLKIKLNGEDISGKGIRESENVLAQYLPDLTSQLIGSIIIFGQGLPYKFTNNTPSGRKDVLEKLSKSDFMIQDLKNRIAARSKELAEKVRKVEDTILSKTSNKTLLETQVSQQQTVLNTLSQPVDFETKISELANKINELEGIISSNTMNIEAENTNSISFSDRLTEKLNAKGASTLNENNRFSKINSDYFNKKSELSSKISILSAEINRLKNIKDICPTCGQKIPNVVKPDTTSQEKELSEISSQLDSLNKNYNASNLEHNTLLNSISADYDKDISEINFQIKKIKDKISIYQRTITTSQASLFSLKSELNKVSLEKENHEKDIKNAQDKLIELSNSINILDQEILYNNKDKENLDTHIAIVNQMNTLVKRDFRGFLLNDIINFIDNKMREYAKEIFSTDDLHFSLNGNNIDILYCGKAFENLSGGEKQRIDIIIQFAIRDMMKQYLNFSSNILILDEIFDQLDVIGCSNILNLISNKLDDIESIFTISHRADELEIPADCQMAVVKNSQGVSNIKWA